MRPAARVKVAKSGADSETGVGLPESVHRCGEPSPCVPALSPGALASSLADAKTTSHAKATSHAKETSHANHDAKTL